MALLMLDSFEHYGTQSSRKWTDGGSIDNALVRTGTNAGFIHAFSSFNMTFGPEYRTLTAGLAYNTQAFANSPFTFNGVDGARANLGHYGDGRFTVSCTAGTSPPSTFVMSVNQWFYLEFNCVLTLTFIDASHYSRSYAMEARINEATILTASFSETVNKPLPGGTRGFSDMGLGGPGGGNNAHIDDFYLTDGEFLGDIKVGVLYPNAVGDSSDWTPTSGANWSNVEEHTPDDDTTTVSATSVGKKDLYNLDDLPGGFAYTIVGAQALWLVKKSDAGAAAIKGVWKSAGTEIDQDKGHDFLADGYHPSFTSYLYAMQPERKSLFTGLDWTAAEINALQLGIKRVI